MEYELQGENTLILFLFESLPGSNIVSGVRIKIKIKIKTQNEISWIKPLRLC